MSGLDVKDLAFLSNGPYTLHVGRGECIGLSGESGVGKTLLLKALCDLIPHTGKVCCDGVESAAMEAPEWRRKVCMIPADPAWWYDIVGLHFTGLNVEERLPVLLGRVGFERDVLSWEVSRLSTGERQRLGLVRGLLAEPVILLLDEPTSALDQENTLKVENLILSLCREQAIGVIWVGHDYVQLERVASRIVKVKREGLA